MLRPATCHDLPLLHAIERSATELYYEAGFSPAHVHPRGEDDMRHLLKYTTLLPVGFVLRNRSRALRPPARKVLISDENLALIQ